MPRTGHRSSKERNDTDLKFIIDVSNEIYQSLDTPVSLSMYLKLKHGMYDEVVTTAIDPLAYNDIGSFRKDYQAASLLKKCPLLPTSFDRRKEAEKAFWDAEQQCARTNIKLQALRTDPSMDLRLCSQLLEARKIVFDAIGYGPDPSEILEGLRFGPGVSSSAKGGRVSQYFKAKAALEASRALANVAPLLWNYNGILPQASLDASGPCSVLKKAFTVVDHSKLAFVPKTAKTDRSVAVEPHANIPLQLSLGSALRRRLKRVGIDLNDQSVNQKLAKSGSKTDCLDTIDLSSASDLISSNLVFWVFPDGWVDYFQVARSRNISYKGVVRPLHKFTTAGCGFTFELESLLFWALARVVTARSDRDEISVYGDDIIVPREAFDPLVSLLEECGLKVNVTKSYHCSPFRESCGADFFLGCNVRPFFIRGLTRRREDRISCHNRVFEYATRHYDTFGPDPSFFPCLDLLRQGEGFSVPTYLGDVGYFTVFDRACPRRLPHSLGFQVNTWAPEARRVKRLSYYASLYESLRMLETRTSVDMVLTSQYLRGETVLRNSVRYRARRAIAWQWSVDDTQFRD